jgi:hypothetical protein
VVRRVQIARPTRRVVVGAVSLLCSRNPLLIILPFNLNFICCFLL